MKRTGKRIPALSRLQLRGVAHDIARFRSVLLLCGILLFGMALGALLCRGTAGLTKSGVALLVDEFRTRRSDQSFWLTFASSFEALFVLFLILFLSGVSAAGVAAVPLVLLFRGAGLGLVMGYFYAAYAFRGLFYVLIMILPNAFLSTMAFLVLGRESMCLSLKIFRAFRPNASCESIWPGFRLYCIRSGLILILLCVSALLDSVLAVAFGSKFVW